MVLMMMLMLLVIQSKVPILPRYIQVRTGMDGEGEVLVLQKVFFSGSV